MLPDRVRADLQWQADDFERLLAAAAPSRLDDPSDGTRWTNRQLLWHMAFGQHVARVLLPLVGGFSHLPAGASRRFAALLSAMSRPYEWVNYAGAVAGARVGGLAMARRWMRRDTEWLLRWGAEAADPELAAGMSVPVGWDPYFTAWMSRLDVLVWTRRHYEHHRAQLALSRPPG